MEIKCSCRKKETFTVVFNITKFSDELLDKIDSLKGWPDGKVNAEELIGKSYGCEIEFKIKGDNTKIKIFTTRPDTIFGASFIALSVDHQLNKNFIHKDEFKNLENFVIKLEQQKKLWPMLKKLVFLLGFTLNIHL